MDAPRHWILYCVVVLLPAAANETNNIFFGGLSLIVSFTTKLHFLQLFKDARYLNGIISLRERGWANEQKRATMQEHQDIPLLILLLLLLPRSTRKGDLSIPSRFAFQLFFHHIQQYRHYFMLHLNVTWITAHSEKGHFQLWLFSYFSSVICFLLHPSFFFVKH